MRWEVPPKLWEERRGKKEAPAGAWVVWRRERVPPYGGWGGAETGAARISARGTYIRAPIEVGPSFFTFLFSVRWQNPMKFVFPA